MRLPPLNALRAFEAAARHEGFVGASQELHVTRGAISRHIKLLEEHLGTQLFYRSGRGVELTSAGKRLLPVLTDAFRSILDETTRIASDTSDLRIICPPATSIRWLIPRLHAFHAAHPDIRVRLTTDFVADFGFERLEYDLGFSVTHWPNRVADIKVQTLFPILLTPACAPELMKKTDLSSPSRLRDTILLHETPRHADWQAWLSAFDVTDVDPDNGNDFPNLDMATKAAVMGAGVVMSDLVLNRDELDAGLLVRPFPDMLCDSPFGGVCLIGAEEKWDDPKIKAFRDWAMRSAQKDTENLPPIAAARELPQT